MARGSSRPCARHRYSQDRAALRRAPLPHRAQLPAAKLTAELAKVLTDMELSFEQKPFKTVISFAADHGPGTCSAQVFVMAPGLHMVDFRRGQSDFLAFFKIFSLIKERMAHVIEPEASPRPPGERGKAGGAEPSTPPMPEPLPEGSARAEEFDYDHAMPAAASAEPADRSAAAAVAAAVDGAAQASLED